MTLTPYWQSAEHGLTLYCGDCLRLFSAVGTPEFDVVVTDPPYGIARENHGGMLETRPMIAGDDSQQVGQEVVDICENFGIPIAVFASPRLPWRGSWRNLICWDKGGAVAGGGDPTKCLKLSWELIQVARNSALSYRDDSVWRHVVTQTDFENHPNEKPVELIERILETLFSDYCDILDPFAGSCTTGVAAFRTGRRCTLIELEEKYCEIGAKRMEREIRQGRLFKPARKETQLEIVPA